MHKNKLYIIFFSLTLVFTANLAFSAPKDFNDRKWDDLEKMPKSLPTPMPQEPKTLPTPTQEDPLKDMRIQEKYKFPQQNMPDFNQQPLMDQQSKDRAVIANQKRWRQMMESDRASLFKRFNEWLEVFHIPKEYHLIVEILIVAIFIACLGIVFYKRGLKKQQQEDAFAAYKEQKFNRSNPS